MKGGIYNMAKKILTLNKKVSLSKKKKDFVNAPDENCFWVSDGRTLKNIYDLEKAFEEMSAETYSYHVGPKKNDFSVWVKEILKEPKLAGSLKKAKTKEIALKKIKDRIKKS